MPWCRPGDKPLSEPTVVTLLTHICVTRPQWVKWQLCRHKLIVDLLLFKGACYHLHTTLHIGGYDSDGLLVVYKLRPTKMATSLNSFSCMKLFVCWIEFHWNLPRGVQLTIVRHYCRQCFGTEKRQNIIWTDDGLVYWRINASLWMWHAFGWWVTIYLYHNDLQFKSIHLSQHFADSCHSM